MLIEKKRNAALSVITLFIAVLTYVLSFNQIAVIDWQAKNYYEDSLKKAVIAYASIRGINAVVSVIKESHLEVAPTGLGISLAAGQVLDPIDDMVERVSDVLVVAIVALGTERVIMEAGSGIAFKGLSIVLLLMIPLIWYKSRFTERAFPFLIKVALFLVIFRFFIPVSSYLNSYINTQYLDKEIVSAQAKLDLVKFDDDLGRFQTVESKNGGILSQLTGTIESVKTKTRELETAFVQIKNNTKDLINGMITITTVYIIAFVVQVLIIPIGTFWGFLKLGRVFVREN